MSKKTLGAIIGGSIGGALIIPLCLIIFSPEFFVKGIVLKRLERTFGGRARVEGLSFGWKAGLKLSNLVIQGPELERPLLRVEQARLKFAIMPLLRGRLSINHLEVIRPEAVIYMRGRPSLDGAPGPGANKKVSGSLAVAPLLPIQEAQIEGGSFTFTDLRSGESTRLEGFNALITGLLPAGTAHLTGACDVLGGAGKDQAELSARLRGFERGLEGLGGEVSLKAGFADLQASLDMGKIDEPGAQLLRLSLQADAERATRQLSPILGLPRGTEIKGRVNWGVMGLARPDKTLLIEGRGTVRDLYLKMVPLLISPVEESSLLVSHRVQLDPRKEAMGIEGLSLTASGGLALHARGSVARDKTLALELGLTGPLWEVLKRWPGRPLESIEASGEFIYRTDLQGRPGKRLSLQGSSEVLNLALKGRHFTYSDSKVKLLHNLDYDHGLIYIKELELTSSPLDLSLKEGTSLRRGGEFQGSVAVLCRLAEASRVTPLPASMSMKGAGKATLDFTGTITEPLYKGLSAGGELSMEQIKYNGYTITEFKTTSLNLKDSKLDSQLELQVNGAPATAKVHIKLAPESPGMEAEFQASRVPVAQELALFEYLVPIITRGTLSGLFSLEAKARAEGLDWDKDLRRTLKANGHVKVEQGEIYAGEVVSSVLRALGHPDMHYSFDSLTSSFEVKGERVYTRDFRTQGRPFDIELEGWTGFNRQLEYRAMVTLQREKLTEKSQRLLGLLRTDSLRIPLRLTGSLSSPHVSLRIGSALEELLKGVLGP